MNEEEILSPREIAIIERWMERHGITIEEPIFYPEEPWQFAMIETIETIKESKERRILEDLPEDIQERLGLITCKVLFSNCSEPVLKDGDLSDLTPAQRRALKHYLRGLTAAERKKFTERIEKKLGEKTEKLKKDLTHKIGNIEHTLGEALEEGDRLKKTLMEERRQWKEEKSRLAKKLNARRSEKKERR